MIRYAVVTPTLEIFGASIVSLGAFNPPILSLDWFCANGLIGAGDAETARSRDDYIVSRQVTRFQTELAEVQAIGNQLSISSTGPVSPALADLAVGIFDLLPHTRVDAIGLNFMAHYKVTDMALYHHVGDVLAPKRIWREVFPDGVAGLANLTILVQDGDRETNRFVSSIYKQITLQRSSKVTPGFFLQINNHFGAQAEDKPIERAKVAGSVVKENWDRCWSESQGLFERILNLALAEQVGVHK